MDRRGVTEGSSSLLARVAAFLAIVIVMTAGVFIWGRVANTDRVAMLLTSVWFLIVGGTGFLYARRRPHLRVPMGAGYVLVAGAATVLLGLPMLGDDAVDETVVTADQGGSGNVELSSGSFEALSHPGAGKATVVELANGMRKLTFTDFETDNGPDLRVYLTQRDPAQGGDIGRSIDLGALKGNVGNQQYDIPADVDLSDYEAVVVWCRAFAVGFTSAPLN